MIISPHIFYEPVVILCVGKSQFFKLSFFRHVTFYAGLDGSIGDIVPVSEKVFRRLEMLQTLVQSHLPHHGGLNPREYRFVSQQLHDSAALHRFF
jgi:hypothetical protein